MLASSTLDLNSRLRSTAYVILTALFQADVRQGIFLSTACERGILGQMVLTLQQEGPLLRPALVSDSFRAASLIVTYEAKLAFFAQIASTTTGMQSFLLPFLPCVEPHATIAM